MQEQVQRETAEEIRCREEDARRMELGAWYQKEMQRIRDESQRARDELTATAKQELATTKAQAKQIFQEEHQQRLALEALIAQLMVQHKREILMAKHDAVKKLELMIQ